jgi:hypothetical protein
VFAASLHPVRGSVPYLLLEVDPAQVASRTSLVRAAVRIMKRNALALVLSFCRSSRISFGTSA